MTQTYAISLLHKLITLIRCFESLALTARPLLEQICTVQANR